MTATTFQIQFRSPRQPGSRFASGAFSWRSRILRYLALPLLLAAPAAHAVDLTVSAAVSLRDAFVDIGREFERANPQQKILFNFGASGQLLQQISRGAPVDVFAAADQDTMDRAEQQNLIDRRTRVNFTRNRLVLVVPADVAAVPARLEALGDPAWKRIAIGNPDSVPAGRYARGALEAAGLWDVLKPKLINTQNVRQALDYVARGEADAGFVYATDAAAMSSQVKLAVELATREPVLYPAAVVKGGGNARGAGLFLGFLVTEPAQRILAKYQFLKP